AFPGDKPLDVPPTWRNLIGEYGPENASLLIVEKSGKFFEQEAKGAETILQPIGNANFTLAKPQVNSFPIHFEQDAASHVTSISLAGRSFRRRKLGPDEGHPFQIQPSRPIADLRREALAATPPREDGHFRDPDLVDLTSRDPSI